MTPLEAITAALTVARFLLDREARRYRDYRDAAPPYAEDFANELEDCSIVLDEMLIKLETYIKEPIP